MNAQGWTASEPATGNFYLYNVGANAYLENGASWGTHAALKSSGFVVNITANNGVYTIGTNSKYSGKFFTDNGYVDTGSSTNWIFEPVTGLTNTYKLKAANGNYAYAAAGMYNLEMGADPGTNMGYWKLVTADNRDDVSGASNLNPIELTHKITNPRFDEYETKDNKNYVKNWTNDIAWGGNTGGTDGDVPSWDDRNPCGEHYNKTFDSYQELTGLTNGTYAVSVQGFYREGGYTDAASKHIDGSESLNAILYANSAEQPLMSIFEEAGKASGGGTQTVDGINGVFPNNMSAASYFFSAGLYWNVVYVQVTDGKLKFGVKKSTTVGADWTIFDNFRLQYFGNCSINEAKNGVLIVALNEAVTLAQSFINSNPTLSATQIQTLQGIIEANDNSDDAFTEASQFTTATETINNALATYQAMVVPYAAFNDLKQKANAIAGVDYTETTSGSHTTFANAITAQTTAADNATSAAAITEATNALIAAIKNYIAGAEPANDGEYFDITCLMVNPNFDDSHNGWTYLSAPGVSWSNCEYYQSEFDINQTVTGLPTGSYSLSVQAFQRPGWAGNVYNDYINGTDNASSVLYINSITSNVKNIAADAQDAPKLDKIEGKNYGDWPYDSQVGSEGNYKYVPNSQQGANSYFGAGLYDATCAAVVDDAANGSLKLGFKSTKTHVEGDWTIFDNFRLYYYGSSLLVYYKQYLPQLKAEVSADLNNGAYANVLTSSEDEALDAALAANPESETEAAYKTVIDNLVAAQAAFRAAAPSYDAMVAAKAYPALTKISANIGEGIFQYNATTNNTLFGEYETAKNAVDSYTQSTSSTAVEAQALVDALDNAIEAYNNQTLNAPDADKRYKLTLKDRGSLTFKVNSGAEGGYENPFMEANNNLAQHFTLTQVSGNNYTLSFVDLDGNTRYICVGEKAKEGLGNERIRTTTTSADALEIKITATTTANEFNMLNTASSDAKMGSDGGGLYTNNTYTTWSIAEASQATVNVKIASDVKWGTRIFPFTPALPSVVKAYSCAGEDNGVLTLVEVEEPAANTPYILELTDENAIDNNLEGWGTAASLDAKTDGLLTGVYEEQFAPVDSYVLQNNNDKVAFYRVADGKEPIVGAYRCYLTEPSGNGSGEARDAFFFDEGEATAIDAISALTSGDAQIFNAAGAQLPSLQKGMNILQMSNGKSIKVMVK